MKKKKVLVLGSTGMLGHMVLVILAREKNFKVHGTHLGKRGDAFYFDAQKSLLKLNSIYRKNGGYDYLINCIGITKEKIDEKNSESVLRAIRINSIFPYLLAEYSADNGARVIHISTDGIFSIAAGNCNEASPHDCADVYGKTKSLGEVTHNNFLNIRCSVIGPSPIERRGLFEWFWSQRDGSTIRGYRNHVWNGVSTLQFAELCRNIIREDKFDALRKESHVFHFAPNRAISKYALLMLLKTAFKKDINIIPLKNETLLKRILVSNYNGLKTLYRHNIPVKEMVVKLRDLLNDSGYEQKMGVRYVKEKTGGNTRHTT